MSDQPHVFILRNHDQTLQPIGRMYFEGRRLFVEFLEPVPEEMFWDMIGGAGMLVLDAEMRGNKIWLRKVEILEISIVANPAAPSGSAIAASDTATSSTTQTPLPEQ